MICLSLTAPTVEGNLKLLADQRRWIDCAELRVDLLDPAERSQVAAFPARCMETMNGGGARSSSLPLICTARREADGGRFAGSEADRFQILSQAISSGFHYVDLEEDLAATIDGRRIAEQAQDQGVTVIRSLHRMDGMIEDLSERIRALAADGEIAKVAVYPNSLRDMLTIVNATEETRDVRKIVVGMGPFGVPTRILASRLGSMLTFASAPGESAAPGHLTPEELRDSYRYCNVTPATRLFAVIGSPISHSRSPAYHNSRFAKDGINACYVPFLVDDVDVFFDVAERLCIDGFSVTIPHKQAVLAHLASQDDATTAAGACNTILRDTSGSWNGVNTDAEGFDAPLQSRFGSSLAGRQAIVVGGGGAARGAVLALARMGMRIRVVNRTPDKAGKVVSEVAALVGWSGRGGAGSPAATETDLQAAPLHLDSFRDAADALIVQTTSLGMAGAGDPIPWYQFRGSEIVYDVVYTPPDTPLIRRARIAGCETITGDQMFAAQAAAQYRLYKELAIR